MFRKLNKSKNTDSIFIMRLIMIIFIVILIISVFSVEMFTALAKAFESCIDGGCKSVLLYNFYLFSKRVFSILGVVLLKQKSIINSITVFLLVAVMYIIPKQLIQLRIKQYESSESKIEFRKIIVSVFPKKLE